MTLDERLPDDAISMRSFEFYPSTLPGHFERVVLQLDGEFHHNGKQRPLVTRGRFKDTEYNIAMEILDSALKTAIDTYDSTLEQGKPLEEATLAGFRAGHAVLLGAPDLINILAAKYCSS